MPNGAEKNWVRLCHAIDGFRAVYGTWPTRVRLPQICLDDLRNNLLTPASFAKLEEHLQFIADGSEFVIEDEQGRSRSYDAQIQAPRRPDVSAETRLGVSIDRPQEHPWEHVRWLS